MIILPGAAAGISVANVASIPFPTGVNPTNAPGNTKITVPTTGNVTISDLGFYQITFGMTPAQTAVHAWELRINGTTPSLIGGTGATYRINYSASAATSRFMQSFTVILQIRTNPSILTVVNVSATAAVQTINNPAASAAGSPAAYMTILKLQ